MGESTVIIPIDKLKLETTMPTANLFYEAFKVTFRSQLRAKGVPANQLVTMVDNLPNDLTDDQYASIAALVVACDAKVLPDLIALVKQLRTHQQETENEN